MKFLTCISLIVLAQASNSYAIQVSQEPTANGSSIISHGGGCRKSSLPGQCCHEKKKTGEVHCH